MGEKLKVGIARVGETPELIEVDKDEWFKEVQGLVGGNVEFFYPPYEDIILAVNEEGLFTCQPNRVVFANQKMEDERYLECFEYKKPVKVGDAYTILFGNIVAIAVNHDEEKSVKDITDDEFGQFFADFYNPFLAYVLIAVYKEEGRWLNRDEIRQYMIAGLDSERGE